MISYTTEISDTDWDKLVDHYEETGMCLGLGRDRHKTAMAKYPGPSDYLYY